ncbi:iron transporter FeoB [Pseudothermotoga hypogea DSM 11164 = NBRC 106472]|uniref:Ferrous iron transport protein B n=2 Tax=Pseudothermotoga TaxID=1643951 RepID=A0A0X1KNY7_9THEM|nr:ferrous iron transport protein B [Pseudothermotoga hypogea]AJC73018.1 iron transporter FeoB [Pseudothermotoga hypogea DSM 11164 = NBRC 106472]MBC7122393.1 ferrous iron transport protein B [Pseudothermotoga sp.]
MTIRVALCGNPNVGKTSLFNALTGMRQYVANWPGVTVEVKEGVRSWKGHQLIITDLPGTYSLFATSLDEKIARDFLLYNTPDVVVVVADALSMEQGLYLLLEILELEARAILVVNAIDEAKKKGLIIDKQELSKHLKVPVVLTSALTGEGIHELLDCIVSTASTEQKKVLFNFSDETEKMIQQLATLIKTQVGESASRWFAIKYLEGDPHTVEQLSRFDLQSSVKPGSLKSQIARERYDHIQLIVKESVAAISKELSMSEAIDHVLTHKFIGIPVFLALMYLAFKFAFETVQPLSDLLENTFSRLADLVTAHLGDGMIASMLADGVLGGVGAVLVFVPNIFALFFLLGIMEDSGYLPRAAFVMDRVMYSLKLSGRSFMSFLLGFGCSVPAVLSTRGMPDTRERIVSVLSVPFISCSARLPVYLLIASIFFSRNQGMVVFSIYLLSMFAAMISSLVLNKVIFKGQRSVFILELPRYRLPSFKNLTLYTWLRGKHFLVKAGTIIFVSSLVLWALMYFPNPNDVTQSFAAQIGRAVSFVLKPLKFDWRASTALFFGVAAKEIIVSTFGMLFNTTDEGLAAQLSQLFDPVTAFSFIVFVMAYIPCFATLATIKSEIGTKYVVITIFYSLFIAYVLALAVRMMGGIFV